MRRSAIAAVLSDRSNEPKDGQGRQLASGGGFGPLLGQKPFKPPTAARREGALPSLRKRTRVNYAGMGGEGEENTESYRQLEEPRKKSSLEGVYKGIDASGVSLNADRRKWAVYQPKPDALGRRFLVPTMHNQRGETIETRMSYAALGVRRPVEIPPRPLHDPMGEHAIVLFDPTIDDKDLEREKERLHLAQQEHERQLECASHGPHMPQQRCA